MGEFVEALERLRQSSGACVLTMHHEARNGENLRGSTAVEGAATMILRVTKDGTQITVANTKQKDAPEQEGSATGVAVDRAQRVPLRRGRRHRSDHADSEDHALTILAEFGTKGATKAELQAAAGLPKSTWYRTINALVSKCLVIEKKEGRGIATDVALRTWRVNRHGGGRPSTPSPRLRDRPSPLAVTDSFNQTVTKDGLYHFSVLGLSRFDDFEVVAL